MRHLIALSLTLAACTSEPADSTMPRDQACQEQADAWCGRLGYQGSASGCHIWYVSQECEGHPHSNTVLLSAQDACLDAIATTATPSIEPDACRRTWE